MIKLLLLCVGDGEVRRAAALGQALRSLGRDMRVCVLALGELHADYGALESSEALNERLAVKKPHEGPAVWPLILETMQSGNHDLVILEELGDAIQQGMVNPAEAARLFSTKSLTCHVFATGASFPDALVQEADLVTEAKCV